MSKPGNSQIGPVHSFERRAANCDDKDNPASRFTNEAFDPQPSPANPSAIERVYLRLATAETGRSTRRPLASMLCRRIATRSAPDK